MEAAPARSERANAAVRATPSVFNTMLRARLSQGPKPTLVASKPRKVKKAHPCAKLR